jgi:D-xylose 1-dehydrogenase (NADP+, D-xylono-1,5-lactone-forming)
MATVNWGILSTSRHAAKLVIPAIREVKSAEAYAVASRNGDRAREYANANTIAHSFTSYEALLASDEIDIVYIPLPNSLHKEWAIKAAQAGKHILCEKPIALNAAEAEEIVAAVEQAGVKLAEAFQWRYHPQAERIHQLVHAGRIGEMKLIDAGFSFPLERQDDIRWVPELGGGALYDVGCYPVAFTRYITGAEPLAVTAQAHWSASGVDDLLVATLEYPGGVLAHINCAFTLPVRRYYEVVGTQGSFEVNYAYNPLGDRDHEILRRGTDREIEQRVGLERANSYTMMVEEFSQAVRDDRELLFPPVDAVQNMRVIDAIYQAARQGGRVEL